LADAAVEQGGLNVVNVVSVDHSDPAKHACR
jgi:hypothetical protein